MTKKYHVYAAVGATKYIGKFEADSEDEAIEKAARSKKAYAPSLCHQCSHEMDVGDLYDFSAEEDKG